MKPTKAALNLLIDIHDGKSQLKIDHMTFIVVDDETTSGFAYVLPHLPLYKKKPKPESWVYFSYSKFRIGEVYSLLCACEMNGKRKNLFPLALLEKNCNVGNNEARNQSSKWNKRIEAERFEDLLKFISMRIDIDPETYVRLQNLQIEQEIFRK
jgi:hypothetical protein